MNTVTIMGNIGNAPDIKYLESGTCIAEFSVAVNKYNAKTKENTPHWISCKAYGKTAEVIGEYFGKGTKIAITGELAVDSWKDKESGQSRNKTYVLVNKVDFTEKKKDE